MCKDADRGLGTGVLYQPNKSTVGWDNILADEELAESAAWYIEYNAQNGMYYFKNAETGKYLSHVSGISMRTVRAGSSPGANDEFQLMPDRTDVVIGIGSKAFFAHGYWLTWYNSGQKSLNAEGYSMSRGYATVNEKDFDFADTATKQQWIIISEDEIEKYREVAILTAINSPEAAEGGTKGDKTVKGIYTANGIRIDKEQPGINIVKYADGTTRKIHVK